MIYCHYLQNESFLHSFSDKSILRKYIFCKLLPKISVVRTISKNTFINVFLLTALNHCDSFYPAIKLSIHVTLFILDHIQLTKAGDVFLTGCDSAV